MASTGIIDSRPIYGWGGSVTIETADSGDGYVIRILEPDGVPMWERREDEETAAWSTWTHPFSFEDAPNPFARTFEDEMDEDELDDRRRALEMVKDA